MSAANELFKEMIKPNENVYAIKIKNNDSSVKSKPDSLVKKNWLNYDYMMFSIENYQRQHQMITRDPIKKKIMKIYYDYITNKSTNYESLVDKLNCAIDPAENEKFPAIRYFPFN